MAGEIPPPPAVALLDIDLVAAEAGQVTMTMRAQEYLYNPLGSVHGGLIATLMDSVMGCAVHSTLPLGRGFTTLEIKVNYLRAVTEVSGLVTAVGRVVHSGRQQAVAEASLIDEASRLCATAHHTPSSCSISPPEIVRGLRTAPKSQRSKGRSPEKTGHGTLLIGRSPAEAD